MRVKKMRKEGGAGGVGGRGGRGVESNINKVTRHSEIFGEME